MGGGGGDEKSRPRGCGEVDARCDGQGGHRLDIAGITQNSEGDSKKRDAESAIVNRLIILFMAVEHQNSSFHVSIPRGG